MGKWLQSDFGRCEIDPINIIYGEQTVSNRGITVYTRLNQAERSLSILRFEPRTKKFNKKFQSFYELKFVAHKKQWLFEVSNLVPSDEKFQKSCFIWKITFFLFLYFFCLKMNVEIKKDGQMILTKEYGSYVNFLFNLSFIRWDKYGPFIKKHPCLFSFMTQNRIHGVI